MSKLRGCLTGTSVEWQHFGLVFEKFLSMLHDGFRDTIEILNLVGLQFVQHLFQAFDKPISRVSGEHVGGAKLCDDLGI